MKKRLMLPAMAFVFAIGLSFATESSTADPNNDYVLENGFWIEIPEQDCEGLAENCQIEFADDLGVPHNVYDAEDMQTLKTSGPSVPTVIPRPGTR